MRTNWTSLDDSSGNSNIPSLGLQHIPMIDYLAINGNINNMEKLKVKIDLNLGKEDKWQRNDLPKHSLGHTNEENNSSTGVILKYTPEDEILDSAKHKGEFHCAIPGKALKSLPLSIESIATINQWVQVGKISRIDLKVRVINPSVSIAKIRDIIGIEDEDRRVGLSYDVFPFRVGEYIVSRKTDFPSRTIHLGSNNSPRRLVIYDPREKHGIENAQDWELRLRDKFAQKAMKKLSQVNFQNELEKIVMGIVFGSVDFRHSIDGNGKIIKNFSDRKRYQFYSRLTSGIERIEL